MRRIISPSEWQPRGIEELEPNADEVVRSNEHIAVTAGPGAGKTELLAQRASFLLETGACPYPRRILAISFKRDAAKNLRERVLKRSGDELSRRLDSFTFDAFAKGIVDQFQSALPPALRPTSEYDVILKSLGQAEIEELLLRMEPPAHLGRCEDLRQFASERFVKDDVIKAPLWSEARTLREWAARNFWSVLLHGGQRSQLSFQMITRLAGELLLRDPRLGRAYRNAYSHAFLDEFQDTTWLQYWLTKVLFKSTSTILTAVGDPRQRIMGWAGALTTVFSDFQRDFGARPTQLYRNHRASEVIAPVVRYLAAQLGEALGKSRAEMDELLPGAGPPPESCAAYVFSDDEHEAAWIADQIDTLLKSNVTPRDIGILVRMKAREYGEHIVEALRKRGRSARVEDQMQDLLTEPIVEACVLGLRALSTDQPRQDWARFRDLVTTHNDFAIDDQSWSRTERELQETRRRLRQRYPSTPSDATVVRALLAEFVEPLVDNIRRGHGQYRRSSLYDKCLEELSGVIASAAWARNWDEVLDEVEGRNAVPILTIHKSKGLEYHAVFFVGLEDNAFWNFRRNPDEESNAFFVALSRAKDRVVFTFSKKRTRHERREYQSATNVKALYELMTKAGVQVLDA